MGSKNIAWVTTVMHVNASDNLFKDLFVFDNTSEK